MDPEKYIALRKWAIMQAAEKESGIGLMVLAEQIYKFLVPPAAYIVKEGEGITDGIEIWPVPGKVTRFPAGAVTGEKFKAEQKAENAKATADRHAARVDLSGRSVDSAPGGCVSGPCDPAPAGAGQSQPGQEENNAVIDRAGIRTALVHDPRIVSGAGADGARGHGGRGAVKLSPGQQDLLTALNFMDEEGKLPSRLSDIAKWMNKKNGAPDIVQPMQKLLEAQLVTMDKRGPREVFYKLAEEDLHDEE